MDVPIPLLLFTLLGSTLGLSFALREPLANLFAGVVLTASQRLQPGDFIRLPSGEQGRVTDIEWDVTLIQQQRGSQIVMPNSEMTNKEIVNFDRPNSEYEIKIDVGVSYDSELAHVENTAIEVAESVLLDATEGVLPAKPFIRFHTFGESDIKFYVHLKCPDFNERNTIKHDFIKRLHERFREEGIEMPYPTFEIHSSLAENNASRYSNSTSNTETASHVQNKDNSIEGDG